LKWIFQHLDTPLFFNIGAFSKYLFLKIISEFIQHMIIILINDSKSHRDINIFENKTKHINTEIDSTVLVFLTFDLTSASADYVAYSAEDGAFSFSGAAGPWRVGEDSVAHS